MTTTKYSSDDTKIVLEGGTYTIRELRLKMADVIEQQAMEDLIKEHRPLLVKLRDRKIPTVSKELLDVSDPSTMRKTFSDLRRYELIAYFKIGKDLYYALTEKGNDLLMDGGE